MLAPLSSPDLLAQGGPGLSLGLRLGTGSLGQVARLFVSLRKTPNRFCVPFSFASDRCPSFQMSRRDA
jgi:hypothetical protein